MGRRFLCPNLGDIFSRRFLEFIVNLTKNVLFPHITTHKCVVIIVTNMVQLQDRVLVPWGPSSISAVAELVLLLCNQISMSYIMCQKTSLEYYSKPNRFPTKRASSLMESKVKLHGVKLKHKQKAKSCKVLHHFEGSVKVRKVLIEVK